jgi:signal transduction histidine kinase/iron only hydrogenase large subunit-like protein
MDQQAEVVAERCIGCGNCVRVCSQGAKKVVDSIEKVRELLGRGERIAALVAPSFAAEFYELSDPGILVGMLRAMGFSLVFEVGFGADLVAARYRELVQNRRPGTSYIATTCPAVVGYIERYYPALIHNLAPIVSPMLAAARYVHAVHGETVHNVFIGPCVAKKVEAGLEDVEGDIEAVLTFHELRAFLTELGLDPRKTIVSDFDPPQAGLGALFPVSRGLMQVAYLDEDLTRSEVVCAGGGVRSLMESIDEFSDRELDTGLLEVLSCDGCISGPGMTSPEGHIKRRIRVAAYTRQHLLEHTSPACEPPDLDMWRRFRNRDRTGKLPSETEILAIFQKLGKKDVSDELNCRACGYATCRDCAVAIHKGLAQVEMCLPHVVEELDRTVRELSQSKTCLEETQDMLMHSERLASMGQLAAGVAHEINNPLGVVLMYSHLLRDEVGESSTLYNDLTLIGTQAERCRRFVSQLLNFARENKLHLQEITLENLIRKSLESVVIPETIQVDILNGHTDPMVELDVEQIVQVLTNLLSNAFEAMPSGGRIRILTKDQKDRIELLVEDPGIGIPAECQPRIFQPFFTTKKLGKGTGLGLAVAFGIVKMHRGDITVTSNADPTLGPTWTKFRLSLPRRQSVRIES